MEIQPGLGPNAIVILENQNDLLNYTAGLNLIARGVLLFRAKKDNLPIVHTPTHTELANIAHQIDKKAQKQYQYGSSLQAQLLEETAKKINSYLDQNRDL